MHQVLEEVDVDIGAIYVQAHKRECDVCCKAKDHGKANCCNNISIGRFFHL